MPNIQSSFQVVHNASGLNVQSSALRNATESTFTSNAITVGNADGVVDLGDVISAREVYIKFLSGDPLLIGFDGSTYEQRLEDTGEFVKFRLNTAGSVEKSTVTTVADVADSLLTTFFVIDDVYGDTWAIGFGTLTHTEDNEISITAELTGATAAQVAAATYAALIADAAFSALFTATYVPASSLVTITDKNTGARTGIVDTGATGFTVATTQTGVSYLPHLKSTGTSQAVVIVAPL